MHVHCTPYKCRPCAEQTNEILDLILKGGEFKPNGIIRWRTLTIELIVGS